MQRMNSRIGVKKATEREGAKQIKKNNYNLGANSYPFLIDEKTKVNSISSKTYSGL